MQDSFRVCLHLNGAINFRQGQKGLPSGRRSVGRRWLNCDEADVEELSYVAASEAIFGFPAAVGGRGGELRLV